jgi:hypothetical protein
MMGNLLKNLSRSFDQNFHFDTKTFQIQQLTTQRKSSKKDFHKTSHLSTSGENTQLIDLQSASYDPINERFVVDNFWWPKNK